MSRFGVRDVVGYADAIKAASPIEIHDLRQSQFSVGVIGVDVKITKQHARCGSGHDGGAAGVTSDGKFSKSFARRGACEPWSHSGQINSAMRKAAARPADLLQVIAPLLPLFRFVRECILDELRHFLPFVATAPTPSSVISLAFPSSCPGMT